MPDLKPSIVGLLEYWGLIAGTVTLLIKSLQAILTNRKGVRDLGKKVDELENKLEDCERDRELEVKHLKEKITDLAHLVGVLNQRIDRHND